MSKSVSIVIPAYNSAATIDQAIQACLAQDYPRTILEVIVVDDGSTDQTAEIVRKTKVKYLRQENHGPAKARNLGWREAKGEIVCFTDADCVPEQDWVSRLVSNYLTEDIAGVGGSYGIANSESLIAQCVYQEIVYRHRGMPREVLALGSYNFSVRRSILEAVKGFDESYRMASGEDNDLSYKIRKQGYRLLFDKTARVLHYHPDNLRKYLRSQFWHGFWRVKLYKEHPAMIRGDNYSNPLDYLQPWVAAAFIFTLPFVVFPWAGKAALFLLLAQLFLQIPVGLGVLRLTGNARHLLLIPVTFLRAFSRGLGMLWGICGAGKLPVVLCLFALAGVIQALAVEPPQQKTFDPRNPEDVKTALDYLKKEYDSRPADQKVREDLAKAYNYYAIQLSRQDNIDLAIDYMQKAHDLCAACEEYSSNLSTLYLRRGHKYYAQNEMSRAKSDLKTAVNLAPKNISALLGLAGLYYFEHDFPEAVRCWQQVLLADPGNQEAVSRLEIVKKEMETDKFFKTRETQNFSFMFEGELNEKQFGNIENILNEVYVKVGQDFSYFPSYKIVVQIYSPAKYRSEVQAAENVVGMYDGKIKLPANAGNDQIYRRSVYHEYMHAMAYDLSGNRCPRWLHEGLACSQDPGFRPDTRLLYELYDSGELVNPAGLEPYFLDLNNARNLNIAYSESYALVKYLLKRFNFWHMKSILGNLKDGMSVDEAFKKAVYIDTKELFDRWKDEILKNRLPI